MGKRTLVGLLAVIAALAAASVAMAESFGKPPGPDQSRCAPLHGRQRILKIGQEIKLRAGPITDQCGGSANKTRYAWQTTDPDDPSAAPGLQQIGHCAPNAPRCSYRAVNYTQPGIWQSVGITGTSPDGGWGAGIGYAIEYGQHFEVSVSPTHQHPRTVTMSGKGQHTTMLPQQGWFDFAAVPGTYTFSWSDKGQELHRTVHLVQRPDKHMTVYFEAHRNVVEQT